MQTFTQALIEHVLAGRVDRGDRGERRDELATTSSSRSSGHSSGQRHERERAATEAEAARPEQRRRAAPPSAPTEPRKVAGLSHHGLRDAPARACSRRCSRRAAGAQAGYLRVVPTLRPRAERPFRVVPTRRRHRMPCRRDAQRHRLAGHCRVALAPPVSAPAARLSRSCSASGSRPAAAYGIPWQVLAAINKIESNFGRNMGPSSAGAIGWMQFMPDTWLRWGTDANGDGVADPWNADDAIFSAARYLAAAGGATDLYRAVYRVQPRRLVREAKCSTSPTSTASSSGDRALARPPAAGRSTLPARPSSPQATSWSPREDAPESLSTGRSAACRRAPPARRSCPTGSHLQARRRACRRQVATPPRRPSSPSARRARAGAARARPGPESSAAASSFAPARLAAARRRRTYSGGYVFPVGGGPGLVSASHTHHDYPAVDIAAPRARRSTPSPTRSCCAVEHVPDGSVRHRPHAAGLRRPGLDVLPSLVLIRTSWRVPRSRRASRSVSSARPDMRPGRTSISSSSPRRPGRSRRPGSRPSPAPPSPGRTPARTTPRRWPSSVSRPRGRTLAIAGAPRPRSGSGHRRRRGGLPGRSVPATPDRRRRGRQLQPPGLVGGGSQVHGTFCRQDP